MWTEALHRTTGALRVVGEYSANAVFLLVDPRRRTSGATPGEASARLPGDALVPWASRQETEAVGIDASPAEVWPWLAQAGHGRGGWYADRPWRRDAEGRRGRKASAEHLIGAQEVTVGQVLLDGPGCDETTGAWTVRVAEPARALVLASCRTLSGREVDPDAAPPRVYRDCSRAFALRPAGAQTRLVVRTRVRLYPDNRPVRLVAAALALGDRATQRAMLLGIKRRVEDAQTEPGPGSGGGSATTRRRSRT